MTSEEFELRAMLEAGPDEEGSYEGLVGRLADAFDVSAAGRNLPKSQRVWARTFLRMGALHLGVHPLRINEIMAEEILLDIFPAKVLILEKEDSPEDVIRAVRALMRWIVDGSDSPYASDVLRLLDEIKEQFPERMADPELWGPSKTIFMAGQQSGFDMRNPEEADAFIEIWNRAAMERSKGVKRARTEQPSISAARQKKKSKRKMEKASRKKNRPKK